MEFKLAITKNVRKFRAMVSELMERPVGVEGMGVIYGLPGEGKTTIVANTLVQTDGIHIRAKACWTEISMLHDIGAALQLEKKYRKAVMLENIVENLAEHPKPIFIDEADYLCKHVNLLDILRDIYDLIPSAPVILIGMEDIARKLQGNSRFARRITQWLEFTGIDREDARIVADTICQVRVKDDLLQSLHKESKGNIGRMVIGLSRIDKLGKASGLGEVAFADWGDRSFFYDQPTFSRKGAK